MQSGRQSRGGGGGKTTQGPLPKTKIELCFNTTQRRHQPRISCKRTFLVDGSMLKLTLDCVSMTICFIASTADESSVETEKMTLKKSFQLFQHMMSHINILYLQIQSCSAEEHTVSSQVTLKSLSCISRLYFPYTTA